VNFYNWLEYKQLGFDFDAAPPPKEPPTADEVKEEYIQADDTQFERYIKIMFGNDENLTRYSRNTVRPNWGRELPLPLWDGFQANLTACQCDKTYTRTHLAIPYIP
jgi:hypothetical protein